MPKPTPESELKRILQDLRSDTPCYLKVKVTIIYISIRVRVLSANQKGERRR